MLVIYRVFEDRSTIYNKDVRYNISMDMTTINQTEIAQISINETEETA